MSAESGSRREGERPVWRPSVDLMANREFICLRAEVGYRTHLPDPEFAPIVLTPETNDGELGEAVLLALAASHQVTLQEGQALRGAAGEIHERWVKSLLERFKYRSRRALFQFMKSCAVERDADGLVFRPTKHVRPEAWEGLDRSQEAVIDATSRPEQIGAATKEGLGRCL